MCILKDETVIILVDFENTHVNGMNGYTYLNETDTVVVYYSDENSAVTRGMVEDLKSRDVNVRMVKLLKQHANALDMYIASTTGMFLDTGEKICIVSKDKGYAAVRDFWHSLRGAEILLGETIEECFLHSVSNDDPRIRRVKERSQKALLTNAFETMNRIPTRPTLSRANARRRRNEELDTTKNLEPVTILPNPLLKQVPALPTTAELPTEPAESHAAVTESIQIEDALPVSVDNVGASAGESGAGSLNRGGYTNLRPETADRRNNSRRPGRDNRGSRNRSERRNQSEAVFYGEERLPENNEESKAAGKLQEQKAAQQAEEKAASVKEKAASAEKQEKLAEEAEKKTTILNEKENSGRVLPRINKNQIRFVYDPATGTMKKLEAGLETEAAAEEKAEETQQAAAPEAAENEAAAETETMTEAEETEADEEASAEETEPVSLEALGIVPMEAFEKYAPGCNTPHQYYIKLVKRFGKPVGKAVFGVTKKEMQAELKRRKQLTEETTESAETAEAAENTEAATETWSKTEQIMKLAGEMYTAMAESVERIRNARGSKAAEAEVSAEESIEEEHPVVEALPVHPEEPVSVMTADEAQTADEVQAADAEAEKAAEVSAVKQESGEVSEEEALAAAQYGHYVQLSMDFTENGDINALRADVPADSEDRTAAQEETKDAAETVKEAAAEAEKAAEATGEANAEKEAAVKKPVRKRRSRKPKTEEAEAAEQPTASAEADSAESEKEKKPARKRTGRKKKAEGAEGEAAAAAKTEKAASEAENAEAKPVKKRGGRRKKAETAEAAVQVEA